MLPHSQLLIVAHGSRREKANQEIVELSQKLAAKVNFDAVGAAFLELAAPSIPHAIDNAITAGASRVTLMPYFLSAGRHVEEDIPAIVDAARAKHPRIDIVLTPYLGQSKTMLDVIKELIENHAEDITVCHDELYGRLKAFDEEGFPKTCGTCGRVYESASAFIANTTAARAGSALKQSHDENGETVIELFRDCQCGSTLMSPFYSRRGSSDLASKCRHEFDQLIKHMTDSGHTHASAGEELRHVITGGYADILEQLKKIARPKN